MADGATPGLTPPLRVERVTETSWRAYRDVRLAALIDSPRAFSTTWAGAAARTEEQWRDLVSQGPALWLAWEGDRPVGTIGLHRDRRQPDGEAFLVGMWVAPAARGGGAAEALMATALEHSGTQGWHRLRLEVTGESTRAGRFYLRHGFAVTGEGEPMPWDPQCPVVAMTRDLRVEPGRRG